MMMLVSAEIVATPKVMATPKVVAAAAAAAVIATPESTVAKVMAQASLLLFLLNL